MKKLITILTGLNILTFSCFGVMVKMPDAQALNERLKHTYITEEIKIIDRLAGKEIQVSEVLSIIEEAVTEWRNKQRGYITTDVLIQWELNIIYFLFRNESDDVKKELNPHLDLLRFQLSR